MRIKKTDAELQIQELEAQKYNLKMLLEHAELLLASSRNHLSYVKEDSAKGICEEIGFFFDKLKIYQYKRL